MDGMYENEIIAYSHVPTMFSKWFHKNEKKEKFQNNNGLKNLACLIQSLI